VWIEKLLAKKGRNTKAAGWLQYKWEESRKPMPVQAKKLMQCLSDGRKTLL
jgi:hypothetical protein